MVDDTPLPVARPALLELGHTITRSYKEANYTWRLIDNQYWQIETPASTPMVTKETSARCPADMVEVQGSYLVGPDGKDNGTIGEWQDRACSKWRGKRVCEVYDEPKWASLRQRGKAKPMHVCVDRYEYPNRQGEYPMVVVSYTEAKQLCKRQNKRLCSESEWTFACEGPDALPYPYGYTRDAEACTIDITTQVLADDALWPRNTGRAVRGIDKAFHGTPSGSRAACKSPFGVYDMTGNLDEWTESTGGGRYPSILKGGFWSKVRARCRPSTRAHGPVFVTYETGFRCCADPS